MRTALDNGVRHLYHYQPFKEEYLANTLERGVVRFADPSSINDPWDCKPVFSLPETSVEREAVVEFMIAASEKHTPDVDPAERALNAQAFRDDPQSLRRAIEAAAPEMAAQIARRYRIYCLTTNPASTLMWAYYADDHRGVCLEFDMYRKDLCGAIQVEYRDTYPSFRLNDDRDVSPLYTKSHHWQHEEEYRLIAQEEAHAFAATTIMTQDGFYTLPPGSLTSIIIGANTPQANRQVIEEIVRRSGSGLLIRQATPAPGRYELVIDPAVG